MKFFILVLLWVVPFALPQNVFAHAFGQLYNLPIPFWMYLYGGAAALVVSFLIIGYFFNQSNVQRSDSRLNLSKFGLFQILTSVWFFNLLKFLGLFLFILTISTGLLGANNPRLNFNMTFFWIIFVLGFAYLTAIVGNIWTVVNPWRTIVDLMEKIQGQQIRGLTKYPQSLQYYPALIFYFLFIWLELFGYTTPPTLSLHLLQYTLLTFAGVIAFGKDIWFTYCDFFSVFFRLISKIAPVEYDKGNLYLRWPLTGILKEKAGHFSLLLFVIFMLASTAFDGFGSTTPGWRLQGRILEPIVGIIFGSNSYLTLQAAKTVGLAISPFVFLYIYLAIIFLTKTITKSKLSISDLSLKFAFSLIPIAFVYNIAHYYTLILTEGQNMIRLISDPFGIGWNLLGTANFRPNLSIINANFTWHSQVALILIGHISAVYLAHAIALKVFPNQKQAITSQLPMLFLMVSYTMIGLWILSQPLTSGF